MAKDEITLLSDISQQLKKLNQTSVRDTLAEREFREQQLSINAGGVGAIEDGAPNFIDAAEDFRRRVKGSITGAIASERFTASGIRARRSNKEAKDSAKYAKLTSIKTADRKVGFSTLWNSLQNIRTVLIDQRMFWDSMLKQDKNQFNQEKEWRLNDRRSAIEDKREEKKLTVINQAQPMLALPDPNTATPQKGSFLATLAKLWLLARALPALLATAAITLAVSSIKDFIDGWKADGLAGAIGKMLGGSGEGIWNSIKQSFKVGGLGATIGGAIGFLFGGVGAIPGAIIGGLIGMAIGAIAGYFGGDRITAGLKEAGKSIADAWNGATAYVMYLVRRLSDWFYTPGQSGISAGPHGTTKASIMGGFISWEPGNFSIAGAWNQAKEKMLNFFGDIALFLYNPDTNEVLGGVFTMPKWFDKVETAVGKVWNSLKNFGTTIKNAIIGFMPDWFTDRMGWTVNGEIPSEFRKLPGRHPDFKPGSSKQMLQEQINEKILSSKLDGKDGEYIGIGSETMAAIIALAGGGNVDAKGVSLDNKVVKQIVPIIKQLANEDFSMTDYLAGGKGGGTKDFHTHQNTDLSSGKGAVTIVQHLYSDGSPTVSTMTIHDHMDLNYGMSLSGRN